MRSEALPPPRARKSIPIYSIQKNTRAGFIWLKRSVPTLQWGPEEQAIVFPTKSEAVRVAERLRANHPTILIVDLTATA